ncbi:MAG TPA: NAD(P)H-quinone oxidoreductase [Corynebacteriales bacterium]|nr:NAD(P)H-quinone oxidoreductase [Mycobacteriales bacterium]
MHALMLPTFNGPRSLTWRQTPDPVPGPGEVLIKVRAVATNRADISHTYGRYKPPAGVSPLPGMECSGTIVALGPDQPEDSLWTVGDECCALLNGGGYAQLATAPTRQLFPIPRGVDLVDAAALPEAACVAWSNLVMEGGLRPGHNVLIQGGAGGMGSFAIQLAKALGAGVVATAGKTRTVDLCYELGADVALNYHDEDPKMTLSALGGANVILDIQGASTLGLHLSCVAPFGRIVTIGLQGGKTAELDYGKLMSKKAGIICTSLRARPATGPGSKAEIVRQVTQHVWPLIETGLISPVIERRVPLRSAYDVLQDMEKFETMGKSVLLVE